LREPQKIECLGLAFSSLVPVDLGIPPEFNQARFVGVQFQRTSAAVPPGSGLPRPVLETENNIVSVSNDNDLALRTLPALGVWPVAHCTPPAARLYLPAAYFNEKQYVIRHQPSPGQHLHGEKVGCGQHLHVPPDELLPRSRATPLRRFYEKAGLCQVQISKTR
jgi:hypothetical protein